MSDRPSAELGPHIPSARSKKGRERALIERIATENAHSKVRAGLARRAQHPKHHGCVRARFIVDESVPDDLRAGLFAQAGAFDALIRFSNGRRLDDRSPDAHGMAIKILGVNGAPESVQDIVLVDHETYFSGDLVDYERINRLVVGTGAGRFLVALWLVVVRWSTLARMLAFAGGRVRSPLSTTYFSTTPYRLGEKVVKYLALPLQTAPEGDLTGENGLSAALARQLSYIPASFDLCVDVQTDPDRQPIEDPTVRWSAMPSARRVRVAKVEIPAQAVNPAAPLAENIAFSPWHTLTAHEPLGAINRARRTVYEAAAASRHAVNGVSPPAAASVPSSYREERTLENNAPDNRPPRPRRDMSLVAAATVAVLLVTCLALEFKRLTIKPGPPTTYDDIIATFKYGSIGAETHGFPYVVWRELPAIFAEQLPGGWKTFGFIEEEGAPVPVGISVRRIGVKRVGFNCATCHSAEVEVEGVPHTILGAPSAGIDLQSYVRFIAEAAGSDRLTADSVIESAADAGRPFGLAGRLLVRHVLVPSIKGRAGSLVEAFAWMDAKPDHGPGRTDAGNGWRQTWGLNPGGDARVGTVDHPAVWRQRDRLGGWFHWDGNNDSLTERNYSAALAGGATDWLLQRKAIARISDWLMDLPAPPHPTPIDPVLAQRGEVVWREVGCGTCHEVGGERIGQVTDLSELGTDPERADLFDEEFVELFDTVGEGYSWQFTHYRPTNGYTNSPLDGIWVRAPYLHNGSVPTLRALLSQPEERPDTFVRGCTSYDPNAVGFVCDEGFTFDTSLVGNANTGHTWGTDLADDDKSALIEYLKTL
ncbi:hypothetical protein [uncultured Jannaschia sp.]|uniref:c-type cytochrome n=1 Tax=uncultured Jannaschia sp. TaxID=293347 RepID=UPI00260C0CF6|nr:hypothetical protein [uncultured Jannaschia sp.]